MRGGGSVGGLEEAAAAVEGFEEGGFLQAAGAPEAVVPGEVVEAAGDELEGGDFWGFEDCGGMGGVSWPLLCLVACCWREVGKRRGMLVGGLTRENVE